MLLFLVIVLLLCRRRYDYEPYWGHPQCGGYGPAYYGYSYGPGYGYAASAYGWNGYAAAPWGRRCYGRPYRW